MWEWVLDHRCSNEPLEGQKRRIGKMKDRISAMSLQDTNFVGFDIEKIQPDIARMGKYDAHRLAERVKWVQGDL